MTNPEEYRRCAREARNQANACRGGWERQELLIIADQYEWLAAYNDLTASSAPLTALKETAILLPQAPKLGDDVSRNKQDVPIFLDAKS